MAPSAQNGLLTRVTATVKQVTVSVFRLVDRVISITIAPLRKPCAGVPGLPPGCGPNPAQCNDVRVTAFGEDGGLMVYPSCDGPATVVRVEGGLKGFDAAARIEERFPPSSNVVVRAACFEDPGRLEAYTGGVMTGMQMMAPMLGVEQVFTFTSGSIDRVVLIPSGSTLLLDLCH